MRSDQRLLLQGKLPCKAEQQDTLKQAPMFFLTFYSLRLILISPWQKKYSRLICNLSVTFWPVGKFCPTSLFYWAIVNYIQIYSQCQPEKQYFLCAICTKIILLKKNKLNCYTFVTFVITRYKDKRRSNFVQPSKKF